MDIDNMHLYLTLDILENRNDMVITQNWLSICTYDFKKMKCKNWYDYFLCFRYRTNNFLLL